MLSFILATLSVIGFVGMVVATIVRKQYLYAVAFACAIIWIVFALRYVPGIMSCFQ